jgi:type I restriction enzyme R subunit
MPKISELNGVERPVCEWLSNMGWNYASLEDLQDFNRPFSNPIIEPILLEKIKEFNGLGDADAQSVLETLTQNLNNPTPIDGNEKFLKRLVEGTTMNIQGEPQDCKYIDFDNIWNNDFKVTQQYWVQGYKMVKTDIVLLVNGIPLVPIEAKQRARKGTNWLEGVKQFSTYQQRATQYWMSHCFGVACNGRITKYGIPGASSSYFSEWKDTNIDTAFPNPILEPGNDLCEWEEKDGYKHFKIKYLRTAEGKQIPEEQMKWGILGLLQPMRVLDILKNYIVFERSEDAGIIKKVARYQQLRAANKIVDRVVKEELKQGVIWHTQGSGKSLTMLFTAYKLRQNEKLKDPTIYIIVDRKDLKEQIGGTFDDCEFPNVDTIRNIGDLKHKIDSHPAGVFITTIQKFRELGNRKDDRTNVILLIDEAHRSQYGDFQIELQNVFPEARRFAFTGTPIPKTYRDFGIREGTKLIEAYLDQYNIKDAIEDGATKAVRYTFGPIKWHLDKDKLKQGWEEITADLNEDETRLVERRTQPWKQFLKHPDRIKTLAKDIYDDYRNIVEPLGYKAQVVGCDKEACVLYYNELLRCGFDRSEIRIIFSEGNYDDAEHYELYKDHYLSDGDRKKLIKQFKRRITEEEIAKGNNLKIFIVCNMLLTGFDAPIEQTMYLDSPLRDHNLLQAIARTNRPFDDKITKMSKEFGRIVDYVGVFTNYTEALNYDPADIGEFEDVDKLAEEFPNILDKAMEPFKEIILEDTYECSIAIVRMLTTLDQGKYETDAKQVIQLYEAISPHPKLRDCREKYLWLNEIYQIYLEEFKRLDFDAEVYAVKTRKLIQESVRLLNFKGHLPEVSIDDKYLDNLEKSNLSPSDKAEKIIRDIETVIRKNEIESPVYVEFQIRLDELIKRKETEAASIETILHNLEDLYSELDNVASLPNRMGFEDRGSFDIYSEIKNAKQDGFNSELSKSFAKSVVSLVKSKVYIGWQDNDKEVERMKTDIEILAVDDTFESLNIDDDAELIEGIMKRVIQHYGLD